MGVVKRCGFYGKSKSYRMNNQFLGKKVTRRVGMELIEKLPG